MRGDGPPAAQVSTAPQACSPHARGWTARWMRLDAPEPVFPACAGMDRWLVRVWGHMRRVPRMRGDGPLPVRMEYQDDVCSPHARGWTEPVQTSRSSGHVFPACAGMDRPPWFLRACLPGVPRMRGDGPLAQFQGVDTYECSPHARGWTVLAVVADAGEAVFPACAGMDRSKRLIGRQSPCVPRMRGDGPTPMRDGESLVLCSPHARGWTGPRKVHGSSTIVFPACAGMDRADVVGRRKVCGVPRMRGDGPLCRTGGPYHKWCSPHARGWTDGGQRRDPALEVFPACAGMDRGSSRHRYAQMSVPRMRGDGPCLA